MSYLKKMGFLILCLQVFFQANAQQDSIDEKLYRPQFHFTPPQHWMNDPNGMFYLNGVYHLYYQHNPYASVWGPMHWGHATSKDLVHWEHHPIALFPDSLGTIFSGSIVVDHNNTSGFGRNGKVPVIAIFTQHNEAAERQGKIDFQTQGIAYSLDEGYTWTKFQGNPVLKNPGIKDFRDPKVIWHEKSQKWIMTLAVLDRIHFYASSNFLQWEKLSEFGQDAGAHGGVWECPDLFPLSYSGKEYWVLLVNLNPGGPNKGSATQYFVGDFDGQQFTSNSSSIKWVDYGPDEYAGVTFHNTNEKRIFLGWMSNWNYANTVPTQKWRSACTIPRQLRLHKQNGDFYLSSSPYFEGAKVFKEVGLHNTNAIPQYITLDSIDTKKDFEIVIGNKIGEQLKIKYNQVLNQFEVDRSKSGLVDFNKGFSEIITVPRLTAKQFMSLQLFIDKTSIELFADDGLTVSTVIFFPTQTFDNIKFELPGKVKKSFYTIK